MKKTFTFFLCILLLIPVIIIAQTKQYSVPVPENQFRDQADNIGYWQDAAALDLVPVNPSVPVKPAEPIKSRGNAGPIDQMSTDVCVWDETGVTQSENSIYANPTNESYVLNSNNSESGGSIYGANYLNSFTSGLTWSGSHNGAGGTNKGDPAAAIGPNGRRYIGFITSNRGQGIAYSDNGSTWTPVALTGAFSYPDLMDKNHLTVDPRPSGTYSGYVYSAWSHFESGDPNDTEIEFSRSTNNGVSWSTPYAISSAIAAGSHNQGVNIQTGPSGQVYAVWVVYDTWYPNSTYENAIGFARSLNGGASFYSASRIHNNILGIRPSPYTPTTNPTGKNMRVNSFPSMAVDISGGPYNGYIYVVWANQGVPGTNTGTNVSVYCMRSTNGGVSWGTPVRVNQGTSANDYASFFPWITCDPVTGKLYCVFYDDRNLGSTSSSLETWCAYSEDGGSTWADFRVGDVSFTPSAIPGLATGYFGDYLGIDARNNKVYPCWTDNRSGRALTYVSPIEFTDYCIATGGCDEYISNVTIGSINNSSACEGYTNYTDQSTDILKGSSTNLSVTVGNGFSGDDITVWADWNRDGDFNDASEEIGYATTTGTANFNVIPPASMLSGPVTMRVRLSYSGSPPSDPCGSTYYGEVEDYTLNVYEYCVAGGGCDEYIANVNIGSINNASGCDGYKDYTYLSTNIDYLSSATVTVTNGLTLYSTDQCGIWVDWNDDGDFGDANETITVTGTPGVGPYSALIDPPAGVIPGLKTMRVRITYTGAVDPCGITSYGEVEDYTINVTGPNTWVGTYNNYWHQAANWSAGHIPLAGEDVLIPNIGYQPVYVDDYPGFTQENCTDLIIESGASVEIRNMRLVVNGNLNVDGEINMVEDNGYLDIYGNALWNSGSTFDATAYNTFINAYGDWNFNSGAGFAPSTGYVDFRGTTNNWIRCYSTGCNFYNLRIYKSGGGATQVSNLSTNDLVVNNLTFITTGAIFNSLSSSNIIMKGPFNYYGTFDFTLYSNTGSVVFDGVSQTINNYSSGSGTFNNVVFSSSTGTTVGSGDLNIVGSMTIEEGFLDIGGNTIDVTNDVDIAGELVMTDAAGVLNCGTNMHWNSGSTANATAGTINLQQYCYFNTGSDAQIGAGNTMNFIGDYQNSIFSSSATSHVGNLVVDMVSGTAYCHAGSTQPIVVAGDMIINAGNTFKVQAYDLEVQGDLTIADGATMNLGSVLGSGFVECQSNMDMDGLLDIDDPSSDNIGNEPGTAMDSVKPDEDPADWMPGVFYVHGTYDQGATGTLNILGGGTFICDKPGTSIMYVRGNLNLDDGLFEISNNHLNLIAVCNINGGTIRCGGTFWATIAGNFQPTAGAVELIGSGSSGQYINVNSSNYFYNLVIDRTNTIQIYGGTELHVLNDFTILSGGLATNSLDMYVGGDWDNQAGLDAFIEGTGKVVFNGPGSALQFINSDEHFNILENNTNQGIRVNSATDVVECNSYNWISGGVSVAYGTFTAYDLAQSGIYGNWYSLANGEINLYQDAGQYVDVYGSTIFINGGNMHVYGGADESYWCFSDPLNLTIESNGVLDFDGYGITIFPDAALTHSLLGGTLKTSGWFTCNRNDFNPAGGTMEFYGGTDSRIDVTSGSVFDDLRINKSGGDESSFTYKDRDGSVLEGVNSNTAYLMNNDLEVMGDLTVDDGTMDLNGYMLSCYGNAAVNNGGILNLNDNSVLAFDNNSELHVNNGGWLLTIATPSNDATITHISTGYYALWIENGGYISAENTMFEYMSHSGVYLRPGSTVNAVYSFNNCTFQNGAPGGYLFSIYSNQTFTADATVFPTNTWGSANNVYKNATSGDVYLPNSTGGFSGETYELDPYDLVHWDVAPLSLDLTVFMEGPYDLGSGKMKTDLNGIIPLTQPFNVSLPYFGNPMPDWYYTGSETVGSIPSAFIVDWVLIQLRDATSPAAALPATTIATIPAFVLNTGDVVGLDGLSLPSFSASYSSNLYAVIWNRNHLGVISANPLVESGGVLTYNFSTSSAQAYGGTNALKNMGDGTWAMMVGDGNGNGNVNMVDKVNVWEALAGESGYSPADFNFDTQTDNIDKDDFWYPNTGEGSQIPE